MFSRFSSLPLFPVSKYEEAAKRDLGRNEDVINETNPYFGAIEKSFVVLFLLGFLSVFLYFYLLCFFTCLYYAILCRCLTHCHRATGLEMYVYRCLLQQVYICAAIFACVCANVNDNFSRTLQIYFT